MERSHQQENRQPKGIAHDDEGRKGKTMPAVPVIQRKVIEHESFTGEYNTDVYKDDVQNVKLNAVWGEFKGSSLYALPNEKKDFNVYVTANEGKTTAAYIRTIYDTDNFKGHVGALADKTAPNEKADAVVNFKLSEVAPGLGLAKSNVIHSKGDELEAELTEKKLQPGPAKLPFKYIMTHEFGHIKQYLESEQTAYDKQFGVEVGEIGYEHVQKDTIAIWFKEISKVAQLCAGDNPADYMIRNNKAIFKLMLLADIIDGVLMKKSSGESQEAKGFSDLRVLNLIVKDFLTTSVEYQNILDNEIRPALGNESMDYKTFPHRTVHGVERSAEKNINKNIHKEDFEKMHPTDEHYKPADTESPIGDVFNTMVARLNGLSKKMAPVFAQYLPQIRQLL